MTGVLVLTGGTEQLEEKLMYMVIQIFISSIIRCNHYNTVNTSHDNVANRLLLLINRNVGCFYTIR